MNYKIELSTNFKKEAKKLNKKFPSLKQELADLFSVQKPILQWALH
jgi:mRNA-degrading endonuclease RelE of RelBE toxin-antitoxin system